jgi:hypothetical protein
MANPSVLNYSSELRQIADTSAVNPNNLSKRIQNILKTTGNGNMNRPHTLVPKSVKHQRYLDKLPPYYSLNANGKPYFNWLLAEQQGKAKIQPWNTINRDIQSNTYGKHLGYNWWRYHHPTAPYPNWYNSGLRANTRKGGSTQRKRTPRTRKVVQTRKKRY